jgi:hypothetical protein
MGLLVQKPMEKQVQKGEKPMNMNDTVDDRELIKNAVESVHRYRDHAMWDKINDYFVEQPFIDDTQLTSDAAGVRNIRELISGWRHELRSYFYATRHRVKSMTVRITGGKQAKVVSPMMGQYFVNDHGQRYVLNVEGTYHYDLVKKSGRWKIGSLKYILARQELKPIGL